MALEESPKGRRAPVLIHVALEVLIIEPKKPAPGTQGPAIPHPEIEVHLGILGLCTQYCRRQTTAQETLLSKQFRALEMGIRRRKRCQSTPERPQDISKGGNHLTGTSTQNTPSLTLRVPLHIGVRYLAAGRTAGPIAYRHCARQVLPRPGKVRPRNTAA